jgi:hypothetical protein
LISSSTTVTGLAPVPTASTAALSSFIDWNRSERSFCIALRMIAPTSSGMFGCFTSGHLEHVPVEISIMVVPVNGILPVSSSKIRTPSA